MIVIDKLCYNSRLRYVNAGEKFIFAVLTLLACVISRSIAVACIALAVTGILTVKKGGIPFSRYLHFMTVPLVFLFFSTLAIVLNFSRTPLDLFAWKIGSVWLTGSKASLRYAIQLILTALASVSCLYFLSFNTPMPDILNVLRVMRCPRIIIDLIYRYIFVLLEIASNLRTAQNSRLGNKDYRTSLKSFGALASALFIRAIKKSNALYDAMESRCYDGTIRVLNETYPPAGKEIVAIVLFELALYAFLLAEKFCF